MQQLERQIIITYRWWKDDSTELNEDHLEELDIHANERINELINDNYTNRELNTTIDDIDYRGWWEKVISTL